MLFIGGTGNSRWASICGFDALAKIHRIRLISIDNFGVGGTEQVPLEHRATSYIGPLSSRQAALGLNAR